MALPLKRYGLSGSLSKSASTRLIFMGEDGLLANVETGGIPTAPNARAEPAVLTNALRLMRWVFECFIFIDFEG